MAYGATGKLLRVNLTNGEIRTEILDESLYRLYPGGKALAGYLLLKELAAHTDPLGPDNLLVFANGLLTGAPVSTATRFTASARSPLTGAYGESEAGGFWGPQLKAAGFDALVITGRAAEPVYLVIAGEKITIRGASALWGQEPDVVQAQVREELGDKYFQVLQTGIAGEHLVRYAALGHDLHHYNGRNGMGAVMASKNLKAIAVRGRGNYLAFANDGAALAAIGRTLSRQVKGHPQSWDLQQKGTAGLTDAIDAGGMLPTRNFRGGAFEQVQAIGWDAYREQIQRGHRSCYACAVRCKPEVFVDDRYQVSREYGGPEYEAVAGFGADCAIGDIQAIAKANELCNRYILDTISTSATIAFAMECYEHGLIGPGDTDGLELRFGNAEAMLKAIELIAYRRGIGDLLADGTRRAAQVIGGEAAELAVHVKGQEVPMHDPRGKVGVGLGYAVSENGADHLVSFHDTLLQNEGSKSFQSAAALGITQALDPRDLSHQKVVHYSILENWSSAEKVLGLCYFGPAPRSFIQPEQVLEAIKAASGWDLDAADVLRLGERATNLARVFNVREGFGRQDDVLPPRIFQPLEGGRLQGQAYPRADFERALTELYEIKGWDPQTGVPRRERLQALDLGWAADLIT
ncbi:MAG: aldehyde ferredoxin oxidoreductase family protein [Rudaea sp.]